MTISRQWAMPNSKTFSIKPIHDFVERWTKGCLVIADPFANDNKFGTITNDLNPKFETDFHLDALDFLQTLPDES